MIDVVANLLSLDQKTAPRRWRDWQRLERQIAEAESRLAAASAAKDAQAADKSKAAATLPKYRERVEIEESAVDELEAHIMRDEAAWEGMGTPRELPERSPGQEQETVQ
jgi:predicted  nucleic acid-binding Zn-ribbon protein